MNRVIRATASLIQSMFGLTRNDKGLSDVSIDTVVNGMGHNPDRLVPGVASDLRTPPRELMGCNLRRESRSGEESGGNVNAC